jgi:hypothetical protein
LIKRRRKRGKRMNKREDRKEIEDVRGKKKTREG